MMVRPKNFGFDYSTASSNSFQVESGANAIDEIVQRAIQEFDGAVAALKKHGVSVTVIEDTETPKKPNAVFPNNWVSFHDDKVMLYPMQAENRRWERRTDILEQLGAQGLNVSQVVDISHFELENKFLESTGSMVLDYEHKVSYACLSTRTNQEVLDEFIKHTGFELVVFNAFDKGQVPVYHTNVLMCIGTTYAVICLEAIPSSERELVKQKLEVSNHEVISLTMDQMYSFAGNMLEVVNDQGERILVMSSSAFSCLSSSQKKKLSQHAKLLSVDIPTIEKYGGGSVRCMMCRLL
ncbi:citrulline utilization hydrolase CtlX [Roseivirga sp.]|uniref:citrulline utilization hydrolase CtlX n=1 Tax=Roseivirga sp. TaxID=1964215 RepID=UPI003BAB3B44